MANTYNWKINALDAKITKEIKIMLSIQFIGA